MEINIYLSNILGKPVIAYKTGGIVLQIRDGEEGFLVNTGDVDTVVKHLEQLFLDNELYDKLSRKAKNDPSHNFMIVNQAASWLEYATSLCHQN